MHKQQWHRAALAVTPSSSCYLGSIRRKRGSIQLPPPRPDLIGYRPEECCEIVGAIMPKHDHHKAAEHHEEAAKAHRKAAAAHEKGDHADASQHSQIANDHSAKANEASNIAHAKSTKGPKKL